MRKRVLLGLLVFLLVSVISTSSQDHKLVIENSATPIELMEITESSLPINMTWTSRWESNPQPVENFSVISGDHVVLNATYFGVSEFAKIELFFIELNITLTNTSRSVYYDTYRFVGNSTQDIQVTVLDSLNVSIVQLYYQNVSFGNWFSPSVNVNYPHEVETDIYNITWSSTDPNADDVNFYQAWLSNDGGASYQLIVTNLTEPFFIWDSTGFLTSHDYIWRIRAFSVDLTVYTGPFTNIPSDYWPGDFTDGFRYIHVGDGIPTIAALTLNSPSDLTFFEGELGHQIIWRLTFDSVNFLPDDIEYSILLNGISYFQGSVQITEREGQFISFPLDGFPVGTHNFTLLVTYPYYNEPSDSVIVNILPVPPTLFDIALYVMIGAGLGTLAIASLYVVKRRKQNL
ncbi:MAG: hypothetical protein ACFFBJ_09385 [Promethearchaeota archaeon]